jgi:hypothetical protein
LTQAVQRRHQGRIMRVEVRPVLGEAVDGPYPVHEERLNGVWRDRWNVLTRKTHAFAKTVATWDAQVILCWFDLDLGGILDLPASPIPWGVTTHIPVWRNH